MMMDDLYICKICKKVFLDMEGLSKHKLNQHPQSNLTDKEITHQFRNSSISITRFHTETVPSSINPSPFRKSGAVSINARRAESKLKQAEGKPIVTFRRKSPASTVAALVTKSLELDDNTDSWQKWEPSPKDKDAAFSDGSMSTIITASVAERATSAFRISPDIHAKRQGPKTLKNLHQPRKSIPGMFRISEMPKNGKRLGAPDVTGSQSNLVGVRATSATGSTAVAGIMQNLGKMKSMNQQGVANSSRPSSKLISLPNKAPPAKKVPPPVPKQVPAQPFRVSKPPQVSKNKGKILPRNAYNNALPKPGASIGRRQLQPPQLEAETDNMNFEDEGVDEEFYEPPELIEETRKLSNQSKKSATPSNSPATPKITSSKNSNASVGGKVAPHKTLSSNRYNPINAKSKPTPATSARNGSAAKSAPQSKANGKQSVVVAKKSSPKKSAEQERLFKKMKEYVPTMPGVDYEMPSLDLVGTYEVNGKQEWVCLVCQELEGEQSTRDMICCDSCEDWYHWSCVGIKSTFPENDPWYCKRCIFHQSNNPAKDFPKLFKNNVRK